MIGHGIYLLYIVYKSALFTPRAHARARGYVIGRGGVYKSTLFFGTNLLSLKILTFRGLF